MKVEKTARVGVSDMLRPAGYRRQEATGKASLCGNAAQATLRKDRSVVHRPLTRYASAISSRSEK
jgi:hypothetical protein